MSAFKMRIQNNREAPLTIDWEIRDGNQTNKLGDVTKYGKPTAKGRIDLGSSLDADSKDDDIKKPVILMDPDEWDLVLQSPSADIVNGWLKDGTLTVLRIANPNPTRGGAGAEATGAP